MTVSFIIPVFNHLEHTTACVASLLETVTGVDYEVIIVNDGSDDATTRGLRELSGPRFQIIENPENSGYAHSNNQGAAHARGEFLFLLNNDLILLPGWFEPMLAAFNHIDNLGLVGNVQLNAASGEIDHAGVQVAASARLDHQRTRNRGLIRTPAYSRKRLVTGACCAIRSSLFWRLGGFDEAFVNGGEDFDLGFRISRAGLSIVVANKSVVRHHVSATRICANDRDEKNYRLLQRRWASQIANLAASRWPDHYLASLLRSNPRRVGRPDLLTAALSRYFMLKRGPAPVAINNALCELDRNERHWKALLDGWTDDMIKEDERKRNASPLTDRYEFEGLFSDGERPGGVWIRETATVTLPRGTLLSSIAVTGRIAPRNPLLPEERGRLGLAIAINGGEPRYFHPLDDGPFSVEYPDPPVRAQEQVQLTLTLQGTRKSNAFAYLGRVLASVPVVPGTIRYRLGKYRPQRLNRRLSIESIQVNGEDVFNFVKDATNPLNTEYVLRHAHLGINLVGWFKAELGIGESVRLAAKALKASGLPHELVPLKVNCLAAQGDKTYAHELVDRNPHAVNIFHIDAPQSSDIDHHHGAKFRRGKYNIAYWAWELPDFPDRWTKFFRYFDEIWTPSNFVRDSIVMKSPVPVITVPHCIDFSLPERDYRQELGLPKDKFLFTFAYDLNSYQERKNPKAVIEAFKMAFAGSDRAKDVGLVIKIHSTKNNSRSHQELLNLLEGVPSYFLIDRTLSREMTYGLMQACDSYVSLHRAEGFGLTVAESMFLGKPVISTNWSGTTEFVNEQNGCPVDFTLKRLDRNFGPYEKGQLWAEANLEHAAQYMQRLVNDTEFSRTIGNNAQQTMRDRFSPHSIGNLYCRRLRAIALW